MKPILFPLLLSILLSCAQFVPPTGGPKDEEPPKLLSSYPENQTLNFKDNFIELQFDELIEASTIRQELIITPQPEGTYTLKIKPFSFSIKFDQAFQDSTTYTFNFRNGIKDLNERNPAKNLKLVFSTGSEIDSLSITGKVTDLWTAIPADEILIGLYDVNTTDTLPLLKRKPNYFTKTDTIGQYNFENIKSSSYRLIGFKDYNLNLYYDNKTEAFGFIQDTLKLDSVVTNLDFTIYPNNTNPPKIQRTLSRQTNYSINFDKSIKSVKVSFPKQNDSLTYQLRDKELLFFNHPYTADTTLTKIIVSDSSDNIFESDIKIHFNIALKNTSKSELLKIQSLQLRSNTTVTKFKEYNLRFEYPISTVDTSKISIIADTTYQLDYSLKWLDKSQTELNLSFDPTIPRTEIKLQIEPSAIKNYKSDSNATYQLINKLYQQEDYGSIDGRYDTFIGTKIAQLIDVTTLQLIDEQLFTSKFTFPQVLPGTYKIRIIEDSNDNEHWDTANFEENKLPERIVISKGIIKVKANFQLSDVQLD